MNMGRLTNSKHVRSYGFTASTCLARDEEVTLHSLAKLRLAQSFVTMSFRDQSACYDTANTRR